jgi:hypothetical protein
VHHTTALPPLLLLPPLPVLAGALPCPWSRSVHLSGLFCTADAVCPLLTRVVSRSPLPSSACAANNITANIGHCMVPTSVDVQASIGPAAAHCCALRHTSAHASGSLLHAAAQARAGCCTLLHASGLFAVHPVSGPASPVADPVHCLPPPLPRLQGLTLPLTCLWPGQQMV